MTAPIPEEQDQPTIDASQAPPGEHAGELSGENDGSQATEAQQEENAETSLDQPSQ